MEHKRLYANVDMSRSGLWVDKYRPSSLTLLRGHDAVTRTLSAFLSQDSLPHLLLHGPSGTGKTSCVLAAVSDYYARLGVTDPKSGYILELNASDERGIAVVRGPIMDFVRSSAGMKTIATGDLANSAGCPIKIVVLDEADCMTMEAQFCLRRLIETESDHVRFCFTCNYLNKILPAIRSRCTEFKVGPLESDQMVSHLRHIVTEENAEMHITRPAIDAIVQVSNGDLRKAINMMQTLVTSTQDASACNDDVSAEMQIQQTESLALSALDSRILQKVTPDDVYCMCDFVNPADTKALLTSMVSSSFREQIEKCRSFVYDSKKSVSVLALLQSVFELVIQICGQYTDREKQKGKSDILTNPSHQSLLFIHMADLEHRCHIHDGTSQFAITSLAVIIHKILKITDLAEKLSVQMKSEEEIAEL